MIVRVVWDVTASIYDRQTAARPFDICGSGSIRPYRHHLAGPYGHHLLRPYRHHSCIAKFFAKWLYSKWLYSNTISCMITGCFTLLIQIFFVPFLFQVPNPKRYIHRIDQSSGKEKVSKKNPLLWGWNSDKQKNSCLLLLWSGLDVYHRTQNTVQVHLWKSNLQYVVQGSATMYIAKHCFAVGNIRRPKN